MADSIDRLEMSITKRYGGKVVLDRFPLEIGGREFVTFLGPSGCGKSTALGIIAGLVPPSDGEIRLNGQRIDDVPAEKRGFGMDEADQQPARDELGLARDDGREQGVIGPLGVKQVRVVPGDDVVCEPADRVGVAADGEELEGADPDVARGNARQHRAGQCGLADDMTAVAVVEAQERASRQQPTLFT